MNTYKITFGQGADAVTHSQFKAVSLAAAIAELAALGWETDEITEAVKIA